MFRTQSIGDIPADNHIHFTAHLCFSCVVGDDQLAAVCEEIISTPRGLIITDGDFLDLTGDRP